MSLLQKLLFCKFDFITLIGFVVISVDIPDKNPTINILSCLFLQFICLSRNFIDLNHVTYATKLHTLYAINPLYI